MTEDALLDAAAERIAAAGTVIAVTGAGASVESGIPDFRSEGGLWTYYPPEEYAYIDAFQRDPDKVWEMWWELGEMLAGVQPNGGHQALAALEQRGYLDAIITQNIDNLHRVAGSTNVIEYHGSAAHQICLECGQRGPLDASKRQPGAPQCKTCGGVMKPDVVFFGEGIPEQAMFASHRLASEADVVIVVGTSATVYPAAGLPFVAHERGAHIVECNIAPTDFTRTITHTFLQGRAAEMLPKLVERVPHREQPAAPTDRSGN